MIFDKRLAQPPSEESEPHSILNEKVKLKQIFTGSIVVHFNALGIIVIIILVWLIVVRKQWKGC
jgi:hypothetical protein